MNKYINPYILYSSSIIPEHIEKDTSLSNGAKICLGRLVRFEINGEHKKKVQDIASCIGVRESLVLAYLDELEEHGLLSIGRNYLGSPVSYKLSNAVYE